jgi:hypothetical protein
MEGKFLKHKVGTKLVVIAQTSGGHEFEIGTEVTVTRRVAQALNPHYEIRDVNDVQEWADEEELGEIQSK